MAIEGDSVLATSRENGSVWAVDVRDPRRPHAWLVYRMGSPGDGVNLDTGPTDVTVADGLAYFGTGVWAGSAGLVASLQIVDVRDPEAPRVLGRIAPLPTTEEETERPEVRAVAAAGGRAVMITHHDIDRETVNRSFDMLHVLDVADPLRPSIEASVEIEAIVESDENVDVVLAGGVVIVARPGALWTADVSVPARSQWAAEVLLDAREVDSMTRSGDRLYVAQRDTSIRAHDKSIRAFDISDPIEPRALGRAYVGLPGHQPEAFQSIAAWGDHVYAPMGDGRLHVLHDAGQAGLDEVASVNAPTGARDLAIAGGKAYVAAGEDGLVVVDITDPVFPAPSGRIASLDDVWGVAVAGRYAYLADNNAGLRIIDVADPTAMVEVAHMPEVGQALAIEVRDDRVFVVQNGAGVHIVDVADPTTPRLVGTFLTGGRGMINLVPSDDHLYVTQGARLYVVDIRDPRAPRLGQNLPLSGETFGVALSGDHVFTVGRIDDEAGHGVLDIFDMTDPAQPRPLTSLELPQGGKLGPSGGGRHGFCQINFSSVCTAVVITPCSRYLPGCFIKRATDRIYTVRSKGHCISAGNSIAVHLPCALTGNSTRINPNLLENTPCFKVKLVVLVWYITTISKFA